MLRASLFGNRTRFAVSFAIANISIYCTINQNSTTTKIMLLCRNILRLRIRYQDAITKNGQIWYSRLAGCFPVAPWHRTHYCRRFSDDKSEECESKKGNSMKKKMPGHSGEVNNMMMWVSLILRIGQIERIIIRFRVFPRLDRFFNYKYRWVHFVACHVSQRWRTIQYFPPDYIIVHENGSQLFRYCKKKLIQFWLAMTIF